MRERRLIMNRNIRDYEVSVWTLQDSFITVLKHSGTDNKGRIEEPDFDLKNDGTLTFKFSIPMYLKENNVKIENPIWYNTTNGNIIADLRKIKVIFHKNTEYEHIFELLITKVTESHEGFQLTCDVECESLAFHELGKSGYKLSLNQDTFIDYWTKWANGEITGNEPKSNIKFWSDRVIEGTDWECEVQMDWSGYDTSRESDIIYEDAYAAAWDVSNEDKFIPTTVVQSKEKERLIDVEESNRYNITQTIAETFGVHCRYEYEHDSDYHITARKIIFYNAFVQEALGPIDINYAYDTTDISREMDSKDTITKMYVKTLTDSNTESGLATIADTAANKSQEDYLLNFDYLYSIGTISQEQYDAVEPYEVEMHRFNEELKRYEKQMSALENRRIDVAAAEAVANNAISLDNERISANNDLLNSITNNTGEIEVGAARPDTCAVLGDNSSNYYIVLRQKGIIPNSIKIYKAFTPGTGFKDADKVLSYKLNYDEFGNLTKITDIEVTFTANQILYLTYKYSPHLYYENILNTWKRRLARDLNEQQTQAAIVNEIDNELELLKTEKEDLLEQKKEAIKRFERLMGAAIREGYWQPEDEYAKYGEKKNEILTLNSAAEFNDNLSSIGWDNELFEGEDKNYYEIEITQTQEYYPCIKLSNLNVFRNDDLNKISFIYQDTTAPQGAVTDDIRYLRFLPIGSQCQLRFLRDSENVIPVLMLTGLKDVNYDIFNNSYSHPRIGILTTEVNNGSIDSNIYVIIDEATVRQNLISSSAAASYEIVYPRIQINSANLKVTEDSLVLRYGNIVFNNYEDYYVLGRLDSVTNTFRYYITIKPEVLFKKSNYGSYILLYELSNTGLFMYLDALQVLKENAYPRVSYEIKPTFVNTDFIRYAYKYLNYIVHINDPELKFEYVKGYITELHLKLDSPKDDSITIDNYKTKFEDLFSTIIAQTQQMQKNSTLIGMAAQAFTNAGELQSNLVQSVMDRVDLNYAFNNGTLTINEDDGIWGTSDDGVVAFRGGGIFTATEKDNGEWIWNTGILPSGINASLITTGQLDTNLIRIFAGDDLKLQMNGDGLFAYRSQWSNDNGTIAADATRADGLDLGQYVVHNGDGLFLTAEAGTIIGEDENHNPVALANKVDRVSITWNGLTLRNWNNDRTLWADADTGNLTVEGTIRAKELLIIGEQGASNFDDYIDGKVKAIKQITREYKRWLAPGPMYGWTAPKNEEDAPADGNVPDMAQAGVTPETRWEEIMWMAPGCTKWDSVYPGTVETESYDWITNIKHTTVAEYYPLAEAGPIIGGLTYVIYVRNKYEWIDGTITYDDPVLANELDNVNKVNFAIPSINNNATVQINRDVGIKVTDDNQNYFQTTATQMGFFKHYIDDNNQDAYTQQLGFTDGNLFVKNGALIGGWTTTNNSLYSGSASTFDADNGIYLGTNGLSVSGNNYKAHFNTSEFLVNVGNENAAIRIDGDGAVMENLTVTGKFIANNINQYSGLSILTADTADELFNILNSLNNTILTFPIEITINNNLNGYFTLQGIVGSGSITIKCLTNTIKIYGGIEIINCMIPIEIYPSFIYGTGSQLPPLQISNCCNVKIYSPLIDGINSIITLINIKNSTVYLNEISLMQAFMPIAVNSSFLYCENLKGGSSTSMLFGGENSFISWVGTRHEAMSYQDSTCITKGRINSNTITDDLMQLPVGSNSQTLPTNPDKIYSYSTEADITGTYKNSWDSTTNQYGNLYQGIWETGNNNAGFIHFNLSSLNNKTILSAGLTLKRISGAGGSSPIKIQIWTTTCENKNQGNPLDNKFYCGEIGEINNGESKTFYSSYIIEAIQAIVNTNNTAESILIYIEDTVPTNNKKYSKNYGKIDGIDIKPHIEITYK